MRQTIQATIYSDSGGYVAECPDLHAVTQGDTLDETIENLRDVISLALEDEDLPARGVVPNPTILVKPGTLRAIVRQASEYVSANQLQEVFFID